MKRMRIVMKMPDQLLPVRDEPVTAEDMVEHWESCVETHDLGEREVYEAKCLYRKLKRSKRESDVNLSKRIISLLIQDGHIDVATMEEDEQ